MSRRIRICCLLSMILVACVIGAILSRQTMSLDDLEQSVKQALSGCNSAEIAVEFGGHRCTLTSSQNGELLADIGNAIRLERVNFITTDPASSLPEVAITPLPRSRVHWIACDALSLNLSRSENARITVCAATLWESIWRSENITCYYCELTSESSLLVSKAIGRVDCGVRAPQNSAVLP